jgi:excisionase family DNA binding protein
MSELLTIKELEQMLKVSRQTIYEWRNRGLPYIKIGTRVRFKLDEVNKWINNQNEGAGAHE